MLHNGVSYDFETRNPINMVTEFFLFDILIIFLFVNNAQEPLHCNDIKIGNTKRSRDRTGWFSFKILRNITQVWFSTCGSEFHTYLRVYDDNDTLIAYNNGSLDSPCDIDKAFLQLDSPIIGEYTLELSGIEDHWISGEPAGDYSIQMFCNNFKGWPQSQRCNSILGEPVDVCLDHPLGGGYKWICIDHHLPQRRFYSDPNCEGEYAARNISWISEDEYTCYAAENCNYAVITWKLGDIQQDVCRNESAKSEHEIQSIVLTDICLPGNRKYLCSDNQVKHGIYPDTLCKHDSIDMYSWKVGDCSFWNDWNESSVVKSIECGEVKELELNLSPLQSGKLLSIIVLGAGACLLLCLACCAWVCCKPITSKK